MILYPPPAKAFLNARQDFENFLTLHPEVPSWQDTLRELLDSFADLGVPGRIQAAAVAAAAAKVLGALQQNAVSAYRVPVWIYLWQLKQATTAARVAMSLGSLSPQAPSGQSALAVALQASASLALSQLQEWHPSMPASLQTPAPGNLSGLLLSLASGVSVAPAGSSPPSPSSSYVVHVLRPGDTLRSLAARYLGNAALWGEIRALNRLRYPYISSSLQQQLGPPIAEWVLQTAQAGTSSGLLWAPPVQAGATSAVLPGPEIYPGNVIVFSQEGGYVQEAATVKSVSGFTVTFEQPLENAYPPGSRAYLCPPPGNSLYKVLGYGQSILIPVLASSTGSPPSTVLPPDLALGTDIAVDSKGNLQLGSQGDLATVSSVQNLQQALRIRVGTVKGALPLWPEYGSRLQDLMSLGSPLAEVIALDLQATLLQDPRVAAVENPSVILQGGSLVFSASVRLQGYTNLDPLTIALNLSS